MAELLAVAHTELILGGQKSGKSRRAEMLAQHWLAQSPTHSAVLLATAQAHDAEMRARIARHQRDRAQRAPALRAVEASADLPQAVAQHSRPGVLVVVDCLTLWLTQLLMPMDGAAALNEAAVAEEISALRDAIHGAAGPLVFVSNEIGLGVIPMGRDVRHFVDALGGLNQAVAHACARVTFMAAGQPLVVKGG
jgi:adenosylcobinamide kinase/adenosylcobinamide-phosphate guanylyltransferase